MKSGKQRRAELDAKKKALAARLAAEKASVERAAREREAARGVAVKREALARDNSYGQPAFAQRGYYLDLPFTCVDCGKAEVWTAKQQKWWFEVAKGNVWTTARRCRACRRRERDRKARARRVHLDGIAGTAQTD